MGTLGDVVPFMRISRRLVALGFRVDFLTNQNWMERVSATGARAVAIAPADPSQTGRDDVAFFKQCVMPSFDASFDHVARLVAGGGSPSLVYRTNMLGASCAAERFGLAAVKVALQPSAIPSVDRPPWPLTCLVAHPFSGIDTRWMVRAAYGLGEIFSPYRRDIELFRRSRGLTRQVSNRIHVAERLLLLLCPSWFALPQGDWPEHCVCSGFPLDSVVESPSKGEQPIVFTPGTGTNDTQTFVVRSRAVAALVGRPAVLLSRDLPVSRMDGVETAPFADLGPLLRGAAAIVHHGGIGTTAEAIRAGVPQLILADRFDQPDNAVRVAQLGLGGAVLSTRSAPAVIANTLREVLESSHCKEQLMTASHLVANHDGIAAAVDAILEACSLGGKQQRDTLRDASSGSYR